MSCNCKPEPLTIYAKSDDFTDLAHCNECKFVDTALNCTRFTSMLTGNPVIVTCTDARTEESLCGYVAKYFIKKEG